MSAWYAIGRCAWQLSPHKQFNPFTITQGLNGFIIRLKCGRRRWYILVYSFLFFMDNVLTLLQTCSVVWLLHFAHIFQIVCIIIVCFWVVIQNFNTWPVFAKILWTKSYKVVSETAINTVSILKSVATVKSWTCKNMLISAWYAIGRCAWQLSPHKQFSPFTISQDLNGFIIHFSRLKCGRRRWYILVYSFHYQSLKSLISLWMIMF